MNAAELAVKPVEDVARIEGLEIHGVLRVLNSPRNRRVIIRNNRLVAEKPKRRRELELDARID